MRGVWKKKNRREIAMQLISYYRLESKESLISLYVVINIRFHFIQQDETIIH